MKEIIYSILLRGTNSPFLKRFFEICRNMSAAHLSTGSNTSFRNELMRKLGCSLKDLSEDCILDLFEVKDGHLTHFNNYFDKINHNLETLHDDEIKALLADLIKSKTNQQIAVIKENLGDIFWKVRKAVRIYIQRNPDKYKITLYNGDKYITTKLYKNSDFTQPVFPVDELLMEVYGKNFKNYYTSEVVDNIFHTLENQSEYCKSIKDINLYSIVKKFYEKRIADNIELFC